MFVHAKHSATAGAKTIAMKVNDTDILVIAIAMFPLLQQDGVDELWLDFGKAATRKVIPVHDVVAVLGKEICSGLLFFHAFSGCDTVSAFRNKGKKSLYNTWRNIDTEVGSVFTKLSNCPDHVEDIDIEAIEKFVVSTYNKHSQTSKVNEARLDLFAHKNRPYHTIPPTEE